MSSPTVIRHAQTEGHAAIVVTYFEQHMGQTVFSAAFQVYEVGLHQDGTRMVSCTVWSTEQNAIQEFEEWRATEIGDMPGNL